MPGAVEEGLRIDAEPLLLHAVERPVGMPVQRVRRAYEQVADQLRELIVTGDLPRGQRLPNENTLARDFGVSRATVREALRVLAAQNLITTAKGAGGGSYVSRPTVDHISEFLRSSINLMTESRDLSLAELLEARDLLEVPAARLAATRRRDSDLAALEAALDDEMLQLPAIEQFAINKDFHSALIGACGNQLIVIAAQPLFTVLQTHLVRSSLGRSFHSGIHEQHRAISAAVAGGRPDEAEGEMRAHLAFLRPYYDRAWKQASKAPLREGQPT